MKKVQSITLLVVLFAMVVYAQPDLSGVWKLDTKKTVMPENGPGRAAKALTVTQKDNKLTVERVTTNRDGEEVTITENYTLDGKKCVNEMRFGDRESTVAIEGNAIVITSVLKMERNGETFEMNSEETWKLQDDGKGLQIDSKSESPRGLREQTLYYSK